MFAWELSTCNRGLPKTFKMFRWRGGPLTCYVASTRQVRNFRGAVSRHPTREKDDDRKGISVIEAPVFSKSHLHAKSADLARINCLCAPGFTPRPSDRTTGQSNEYVLDTREQQAIGHRHHRLARPRSSCSPSFPTRGFPFP